MSAKELTFIMPTYNSASYLKRTLKSVEKMLGTYGDKAEILFVDDGSLDGTVDILKKEVKRNPNYRFLVAKHGGASKARNIGIKNARGKYVTFIDSDDLYAANFVLRFLKQTKQEPDIVWEDVQNLPISAYRKIKTANERIELMQMVLGLTAIHIQEGIASKFYRRRFLLENNLLFDEEIVVSEDTLFILEALDRAKSIYISNFKFYTILEEHSLSRFNEKVLASELKYEEKIAELLEKYTNINVLESRIKLNGIYTLLRRYYGAKYQRQEFSLTETVALLSELFRKYGYQKYTQNGSFDRIFSKRYKMLRILLRYHLWRSAILLNTFLDKIKGTTWN